MLGRILVWSVGYLVTSLKTLGYDSYDSFVICCESEDIARKTHPECGIYEWWKDGQYPSSIDWGWVQSSDIYDQLEVVCIGIADSKLEKGIVISSFNAG